MVIQWLVSPSKEDVHAPPQGRHVMTAIIVASAQPSVVIAAILNPVYAKKHSLIIMPCSLRMLLSVAMACAADRQHVLGSLCHEARVPGFSGALHR